MRFFEVSEKYLERELAFKIDASGEVREIIDDAGIGAWRVDDDEYRHEEYDKNLDAKVAEQILIHKDVPWVGERDKFIILGELHLINFIGRLRPLQSISLIRLDGVWSVKRETHPLATPFSMRDFHAIAAGLDRLSIFDVKGLLWQDFCSSTPSNFTVPLSHRLHFRFELSNISLFKLGPIQSEWLLLRPPTRRWKLSKLIAQPRPPPPLRIYRPIARTSTSTTFVSAFSHTAALLRLQIALYPHQCRELHVILQQFLKKTPNLQHFEYGQIKAAVAAQTLRALIPPLSLRAIIVSIAATLETNVNNRPRFVASFVYSLKKNFTLLKLVRLYYVKGYDGEPVPRDQDPKLIQFALRLGVVLEVQDC